MAVLTLKATQLEDDYRGKAVEHHAKLRYHFFNLPAVAVAGDANSIVELCDLPPGAVRIMPGLSRLKVSALGASRTLDLGHRAYTKKDNSADEPENETAFIAARDVSGATDAMLSTSVLKYDVFSKAGVRLFAKIEGGTLPVGATIDGYVAYLYE